MVLYLRLEKEKIIKISDKPVLKRGNLGSFDDSAAIPSHLIKIRNKYYLYYVGWTRGFKVPYFSTLVWLYQIMLRAL